MQITFQNSRTLKTDFLEQPFSVYFFFLLGGPGENGLFSSPVLVSSLPSSVVEASFISTTTTVPSFIPLSICVRVPLVIPVCTLYALNVRPSRTHNLWEPLQSTILSFAPTISFVGVKRKAFVGTLTMLFCSSV